MAMDMENSVNSKSRVAIPLMVSLALITCAVPASAQSWTTGIGGEQTGVVRCGNQSEGEAVGVSYITDPTNKAIISVGLVCNNFSWLVFNRNTSANPSNNRRYASKRTSGREGNNSGVVPRGTGTVQRALCPAGTGRTPEASADSFLIGLGVRSRNEAGKTIIVGLDLTCAAWANNSGRVQDGFRIAVQTVTTNGRGNDRSSSTCPGLPVNKLAVKYSAVSKEGSLLNLTDNAPNAIMASCADVRDALVTTSGGGGSGGGGGTGGGQGERKLSFASDLYPVITTGCAGCHGGNRLYPQKLQTNAGQCGVASEPAIPFSTSMSAATMLNRLKCLKASSRDGNYTRALGKVYVVPGNYSASGLHWKAQASDAFSQATKDLIQNWIAQGANP